jgi:membrane fusion protein (multidrug efflux system)
MARAGTPIGQQSRNPRVRGRGSTGWSVRPFHGRLFALLLLGVLLPGLGCTSRETKAPPPQSVAVEVAPVKVAPLEETLSAVGSLASPQETVVTSQIDGKVATLSIRQGQVAARGSVLATLDDSVQRAEVRAAEATLFNARQIYRRDQKVRKIGGISEQQLLSDEAAVRQAEAQVEQARASLAYTRIRAPFTGALGLRQVSLGSFVKAGNAIVGLHQVDPLHLDFSLPQQEVSRLRVGQPVRFTVVGLPETFQGQVTSIDPALAAGSRTVQLQATVPNHALRLKPGMFARVRLIVGTVPQALFVPMQALTAEGQVDQVWVVGPEEKAERRTVEVGTFQDNWVHIRSGLTPQDRVVTAGVQKLRPGAPLRISPYQPIHNPRLKLAPSSGGGP